MSQLRLIIVLLIIKTFILLNENFVNGFFCEKDSDCVSSYRRFCCRRESFSGKNRCRANCVGHYCSNNNDCRGHNECCSVSNRCTTYGCPSECETNADCKSGTYCCRKKYITGRNVCLPNCVGESCHSDIDCGGKQECCSLLKHCTTYRCRHQCLSNDDCLNNTVCCRKGHKFDKNSCMISCLGESCESDTDCGKIGLCCGSNFLCTDNCLDKNKALQVWVIVIIVVFICLAVFLVGVLGVVCARKQRLKLPAEHSEVAQSSGVKHPTPPAILKAEENSYRRPLPIPPPRTKNSEPSPLKTLKITSNESFDAEEKLPPTRNSCPPTTFSKPPVKPPLHPRPKSDAIQREPAPDNGKKPLPLPPGVQKTPDSDKESSAHRPSRLPPNRPSRSPPCRPSRSPPRRPNRSQTAVRRPPPRPPRDAENQNQLVKNAVFPSTKVRRLPPLPPE